MWLVISVILVLAGLVQAGTITVGQGTGYDYNTIQAGIYAATDGDTVLVADGTYIGLGNKNLSWDGNVKHITVKSENGPENCIIDCENDGRGFYFNVYEGSANQNNSDIIDGFTITNGVTVKGGYAGFGGAILCLTSSPTILNCIISQNTASMGGGIFCEFYSSPIIDNCKIVGNSGWGGGIYWEYYCSPTITNCIISGNTADASYGGGLYCGSYASGTITNCIISGNIATWYGGGVWFSSDSSLTIDNCTIVGNTAYSGGGIYIVSFSPISPPTITNCIIYDNTSLDLLGYSAAYSCVGSGNTTGIGNTSSDPLFIDADGLDDNLNTWEDNDYHLSSGSPCIDSADGSVAPQTDKDGNLRYDDPGADNTGVGSPNYVDIGAYEFQGTTPPSKPINPIPSNGASDQLIDVDIIWSNSGGATSFDVYFGTDNPPTNIVNGTNQTKTSYDSGTLNYNTPYYWRIDAKNSGGTTTGDVWSFTTETQVVTFIDTYVDDDYDSYTLGWQVDHFATIQTGIDAAGDGCTVLVADGTYTGAGNRDIDFNGKSITVRSENGPENCIIDCQGTSSDNHRGFYFNSAEDSNSIVDGFTIKNGYAEVSGGGIYCDGSSPTITNCVISLNTADLQGGGICYVDSSVSISNCIIEENKSPAIAGVNGIGGGITCLRSSGIITNCTITNNSARSGGGICFKENSTSISITNCTILNNVATHLHGGGIYCWDSNAIISNCAIVGNTAIYQGGGVGLYESSAAEIINCTISENTTDYYGGGIHCSYSPFVAITNCTIAGNTANRYGGGIELMQSFSSITNCTILQNSAGEFGGGVSCVFSSPTITNSTIVANTAYYYGGGIYCDTDASPNITNSILWNDTAMLGAEIALGLFRFSDSRSSTLTIGYNTVAGGEANVYKGSGCTLNWDNGSMLSADPLFADPDGPDNNRDTWEDNDYRLWAGSPCIDTADSSVAPTTDMDGNPRYDDLLMPNGPAAGNPPVDMGAYERQEDSIIASISGVITYWGYQTGTIYVRAFDDPNFTGSPVKVSAITDSGPYTLNDLSGGTYYISAYRDDNGNEIQDKTEAWGYVGAGSPAAITVTGEDLQGLNFAIRDPDTDTDGLSDWWEIQNFSDLSYDADDDPDNDALDNSEEYEHSANPDNNDTDGDGMTDGWEVQHRLDPNNAEGDNGADGDPDGDGYTNLEEYQGDSDPQNEFWVPFEKGDINKDSIVDTLDATLCQRMGIGLEALDLPLGDLNYDGVVDISDAVLAARKANGLLCSISGQVSYDGGTLAGVTIDLEGDALDSTATENDGTYYFSDLSWNSFTLTPSLQGYRFIPESQTVKVTTDDVADIDFQVKLTVFPDEGDYVAPSLGVSQIEDDGITWDVATREVVVELMEDAMREDYEALVAFLAARNTEVIGQIPDLMTVQIQVSDDSDILPLIDELRALPYVEDAHFNMIFQAHLAANEELPIRLPVPPELDCGQWWIEDIRAPEAWRLFGEGPVGKPELKIAIIDGGIYKGCGQFSKNLSNMSFYPSSGQIPDTLGTTMEGLKTAHGTTVAALMIAHGDDGITGPVGTDESDMLSLVFGQPMSRNITGVAWDVSLLSFDVRTHYGGTTELVTEQIMEAVKKGARVINISLGKGQRTDLPEDYIKKNQWFNWHIRKAVKYAKDNGALIIKSAGNQKEILNTAFPPPEDIGWLSRIKYDFYADCWRTNVVVVCAHNQNRNVSGTLYGNGTDISAPGLYVTQIKESNWIFSVDITEFGSSSVAAPLVSGAAALMWSKNPTLEAKHIKEILVLTGTSNLTSDGLEPTLDLYAALMNDNITPPQVGDLTVTSGDVRCELNYTNPPNSGTAKGSGLAEVVVRRKTSGYPIDHTDGNLVHRDTSPIAGEAIDIIDLSVHNDTTYYYGVFPKNSAGVWNNLVDEGKNAEKGTPEAAPVLQVTPPSYNFGAVAVGSSEDITFTVTNEGGGILSGNASGLAAPFSFVGDTSYSLAADETKPITVRFIPTQEAYQYDHASFSGGDGASCKVEGTGSQAPNPVIEVTPSIWNFGTFNVGTSVVSGLTVKNVGTGTLTGSASGLEPPFSFDGDTNYSLGPGESKSFRVFFTPTEEGYRYDYAYFSGGGGASYKAEGTGKLGPILKITPDFLDFGTVSVGSNKDLTFTVKNIGTGTLIGSASGLNPPFSFVSDTNYSLGNNQSKPITVRFSPTQEGYRSDKADFIVSSGQGSAYRQVKGTGEMPIGNVIFHDLLKLFDGWVGQAPMPSQILPVLARASGTTGNTKWVIDWGDGYVQNTEWKAIGSTGTGYNHQYAVAQTYTVHVDLYWDQAGLVGSKTIELTPVDTGPAIATAELSIISANVIDNDTADGTLSMSVTISYDVQNNAPMTINDQPSTIAQVLATLDASYLSTSDGTPQTWQGAMWSSGSDGNGFHYIQDASGSKSGTIIIDIDKYNSSFKAWAPSLSITGGTIRIQLSANGATFNSSDDIDLFQNVDVELTNSSF